MTSKIIHYVTDEVSSDKDLNGGVKQNTAYLNVHVYNHDIVDKNSNPLYIHKTNYPGLVLISKKLVEVDNYAPWCRSMQIALNARNIFVLVNDTYDTPDVDLPLCAL